MKMVLLVIVFLLVGCTQKTVEVIQKKPEVVKKQPEEIENPYFGDYSTDRIRGMWGTCFTASTSKNPMVPPPLHAVYCDCMVNKVRGRYSQKYLTTIKASGELNKIMIDIAQECVDEVIHPVFAQQPKPEAEKTMTHYG